MRTSSNKYSGGWQPGEFALYSDFGLRSMLIVRVLPREAAPPEYAYIQHYEAARDLVLAEVVDNSLYNWDMDGYAPPWNAIYTVHTFNYTNLYRNIDELIKHEHYIYAWELQREITGLREPERWNVLVEYGLAKRTEIPKAFEWNPSKEWHDRRQKEAGAKIDEVREDPSREREYAYWIGRRSADIFGLVDDMHREDFRRIRDAYKSEVMHPSEPAGSEYRGVGAMYWRGRLDAVMDALKEDGMTNQQIMELNPARAWHQAREISAYKEGQKYVPRTPVTDTLRWIAYGKQHANADATYLNEPEKGSVKFHKKQFLKNRAAYAEGVKDLAADPNNGFLAYVPPFYRGKVDAEIEALKAMGVSEDRIRKMNPMGEDIRQLQARVNALIDQRRRYGVRKEVAANDGRILYWSNSGYWMMQWHPVTDGTVMELDANEVFVKNANEEDLEFLTEGKLKYLKPLPLWGGSFERMSSPDYTGVELPPMIKHIRDEDLPRTKEVDEALRRKSEESNPLSRRNPRIRKIGQYFDGKELVWIWLVNGMQVRNHLIINFTQGGHHYVYKIIPENEIWIDDHNYDERYPISVHEAHERNRMKFKKMSYSRGHDLANGKEKKVRKAMERAGAL